MRSVTVLVLAGLVVVFGGLVVVTLGGGGTPDGALTEQWISDTARNVTYNHHAVGVGPDGNVIVAPVATIATNNSRLSPTSCSLNRLATPNGTVQWQTTIPPADCFMHALSQPAVADVDDDRSLEVAASTIQNATVVYDAASGDEEVRIPLSTYGYARPTVANVTSANGPEIVASDIDGYVVVADGDGEQYWTRSLNETVWAAPSVGDVDADEQQEVVVGTDERTVAMNADGSIAWKASVAASDLDIGQGDDDAAMEIFVTSGEGVTSLDGQDGTIEWKYAVRGGASLSLDAIGTDDSGSTMVYFSQPKNVVGALDAASGKQAWSTRLGPNENTMTPAPVVGDLTGDGTQELVTVTNGGTVTVLQPDSGSQLAVYRREVPIFTFPTVADITPNPGKEILVRYGDGRVVMLTYGEGNRRG